MSRFAERIFPWLSALIAIAFVSIGIDELFYETGPRPHRFESVLWAFAISVVFGLSAASIWLRWRVSRIVALVCGLCVAAWLVSALIGSWDKVSEAGMVVLVVFACFTAALAFIFVGKRNVP
jgi:hypothetical protein